MQYLHSWAALAVPYSLPFHSQSTLPVLLSQTQLILCSTAFWVVWDMYLARCWALLFYISEFCLIVWRVSPHSISPTHFMPPPTLCPSRDPLRTAPGATICCLSPSDCRAGVGAVVAVCGEASRKGAAGPPHKAYKANMYGMLCAGTHNSSITQIWSFLF